MHVCANLGKTWWHLKKKVFCPNDLKWNIDYIIFQLEGTCSDHLVQLLS